MKSNSLSLSENEAQEVVFWLQMVRGGFCAGPNGTMKLTSGADALLERLERELPDPFARFKVLPARSVFIEAYCRLREGVRAEDAAKIYDCLNEGNSDARSVLAAWSYRFIGGETT